MIHLTYLINAMPRKAKRVCTWPGCQATVDGGRCSKHANGSGFVRDPEVKRLYNSKRWQVIREEQLRLAIIPSLADYPLCVTCYRDGRLVKATEVDHIYPHRGDVVKFFAGPFQCLCKSHHSAKTKVELGI